MADVTDRPHPSAFALLPFNIYFSRTVLPEIPLVFFSLGSIYFLIRYFSTSSSLNLNFILSALFAALSLLIKPTAIFLSLPIFYLSLRKCRFKLFIEPSSYLYLFLAVAPFLLWRWWISHFPEGIPAFLWLLNGNTIRFKGAFFRWLFAERLGKLILGYWGSAFLTLGLLQRPTSKEGWFYHVWFIAILIYFTVFATGNVQHDYYQILAIPVLVIFIARGISVLLDPLKHNFPRLIAYPVLALCFLFMLAFSWYEVRGFYNINHPEIVAAGQAVDNLVEPDALVIAPYQGDTAFLYQTNRRGWPIGGDIQTKIDQGADYYVSTSFDAETQKLSEIYPAVSQTNNFVIIKLQMD